MRKGEQAKTTKSGLTPLQENFAHEYLVDNDPGKAYLRAGYSANPKYAHRHGMDLLKNHRISMRIDELVEQRNRMTDVTAERVLLEMARMGFAKITDAVHWDESGNTTFTPSDQLSDDIAPAISEYYETSRELDDGSVYKTRRFKMHDKSKMLQELAKHTGLTQQQGPTVNVNVEQEKRRASEFENLFKEIDNYRAEHEQSLPEEKVADEIR
jgi:phage terminase small subunit